MSEKTTARDAVLGHQYTTGGRSVITVGELYMADGVHLRRIVNEHGVHTDVALDYPLWPIDDEPSAEAMVHLVGVPEFQLQPLLAALTDAQLSELVQRDGRTWLLEYELERLGSEPSQPAPAPTAVGECTVCGKSQKLRPKHGTEDVLVLVAHNSAPGTYCLGGGEPPVRTGTVWRGGQAIAEVEIGDDDTAADVAVKIAAASDGALVADGATVIEQAPSAPTIIGQFLDANPHIHVTTGGSGPVPLIHDGDYADRHVAASAASAPPEPEAPVAGEGWLLVREFDDTTETAADIEVSDRVADIMADAVARGVADIGAVVASINAALPDGYIAVAEGATIRLEGPPRNPWLDSHKTTAARLPYARLCSTMTDINGLLLAGSDLTPPLQAEVLREFDRQSAALEKVQAILGDEGPKTDKGRVSKLRARMEQSTTKRRPGVMVAIRIALEGLAEHVSCDGNHPMPPCKDPICWHGEPPATDAASVAVDIAAAINADPPPLDPSIEMTLSETAAEEELCGASSGLEMVRDGVEFTPHCMLSADLCDGYHVFRQPEGEGVYEFRWTDDEAFSPRVVPELPATPAEATQTPTWAQRVAWSTPAEALELIVAQDDPELLLDAWAAVDAVDADTDKLVDIEDRWEVLTGLDWTKDPAPVAPPVRAEAPTISDAEADLVDQFIAKQTEVDDAIYAKFATPPPVSASRPRTIMDGMTREQLMEFAQIEPGPPTLGQWLAQLPLVMAEAEAAGIRIRIDPLPKR